MQSHLSLLLLLALLTPASISGWAQTNENPPQRRTISVTGTAQVTADADMAMVRVGYRLYAPDAKTAYASAITSSNAITQALIASGIAKSAIESTGQVLQRTQPYEMGQLQLKNDEREQRQFTATQSWTIRVKPDDAAGALDTAIKAGANESGWIQWIASDPSALQARASSEAIANAHTIAEQIAEKSGVHLGQLVTVSQNQGQGIYGGGFASVSGSSYYGMGSAVMVTGGLAPTGQQLAVNSRRIEVTVSVFATYAIE